MHTSNKYMYINIKGIVFPFSAQFYMIERKNLEKRIH